MLSPDVNILVYAHREETPQHQRYAEWFTNTINSDEPFAISELVISGFLRIVTNPKIFRPPTPLNTAWDFIDQITQHPRCHLVRPEAHHLKIFRSLSEKYKLSGKLIADAYHAALVIEHGLQWVSADTDFARFQNELRFIHL